MAGDTQAASLLVKPGEMVDVFVLTSPPRIY